MNHEPPGNLLIAHHEHSEIGLRLTCELRPAGGGVERFPTVEVIGSPMADVSAIFQEIESLDSRSHSASRSASDRLAGFGARLAGELLPRPLLERLRQLAVPTDGAAASLMILSNETWLPWEILRLPDDLDPPPGAHLVEVFALTRWLDGAPWTLALSLDRLAIVSPSSANLEYGRGERATIAEILGERASPASSHLGSLLDELSSGAFDAVHFCGHGVGREPSVYRRGLVLDRGERLLPSDLKARPRPFGDRHPLVFLNGCYTGRGGEGLTGAGGLAESFLDAGAGAMIGTHWAIDDEAALSFATELYPLLVAGSSLGEAIRTARLSLRDRFPGDPTWLAYMAYGLPAAVCGARDRVRRVAAPASVASVRTAAQLRLPLRRWSWRLAPPGAMLQAEYGVVPFHGRDDEIDDLWSWCQQADSPAVRMYTGAGGMGKTRLAVELCERIRGVGWLAGFLDLRVNDPERVWADLVATGADLLLVLDYAEVRHERLVPLLRRIAGGAVAKVRLLLLARSALAWWVHLRGEADGVGDLLSGPATECFDLGPLADSPEKRARSFELAVKAFSDKLDRPAPAAQPDLGGDHFQRILLLHMSALELVGGAAVTGENGILDRLLARERRFWRERAVVKGLNTAVAEGIGRAMAAITLARGVSSERQAVGVLGRLELFAGEKRSILTQVAHLLHECYPGSRWIEPLLPDGLGDHLIRQEIEAGAEEFIPLFFGPGRERKVQS